MIFQFRRVRLLALPDIAKKLTAFQRKNFSMCLKRPEGNGELSLYPYSLFFWQGQAGSGFTDVAVRRCTPCQAGCSLLKSDGIDNATRWDCLGGLSLLANAVRSPTIRTFISLSLIMDGFVSRACDSPIRFARVMFSKKISVLSKIFLVDVARLFSDSSLTEKGAFGQSCAGPDASARFLAIAHRVPPGNASSPR